MLYVRSDVQVIIRRDWFQQPRGETSTRARAHSTHRERHETHVSFSLAQIEFERHVALQFVHRNFVVNENRAQPIREEQWFAFYRKQSPARRFVEFLAGFN